MRSCIFHDTEPSQQDRRLFEIVEDAYDKREKVVIFAKSVDRASEIDRFLWISKQDSFIPHKVFAAQESKSAVPIATVTSEMNPIGAGTLVADGHCSLEFALGFDAVHEFVSRSSPDLHEACRDRFRAYRAKGMPVKHKK